MMVALGQQYNMCVPDMVYIYTDSGSSGEENPQSWHLRCLRSKRLAGTFVVIFSDVADVLYQVQYRVCGLDVLDATFL